MAFLPVKPEIVYEDDAVLVVYKPTGLATQTSNVGEKDLVSELKKHLKGGYVAVVHRLDQPVEGLLVFAKSSKAAAALSKAVGQKDENDFAKDYLAVVCGKMAAESGRLEDFLIKDGNVAKVVTESEDAKMKEGGKAPGAKKAVLDYEVLKEKEITGEEVISLVRVHLHTGRFHQIRAQLANSGAPIIGDSKYGTERSMELSKELGARNVTLIADSICFVHPISGKKMEFHCEPKGSVFKEFS